MVFSTLEDNQISKQDGTKRNVQFIADYDIEAKNYIIYQLFCRDENAAEELKHALEISEVYVSNELLTHVVRISD